MVPKKNKWMQNFHFIATNFSFMDFNFPFIIRRHVRAFTIWAPRNQFFSFGKWSQKIFFLEPEDLNDLDRVEAHLYNFCSIFDYCLHASFCWWANAKCKNERGSIVKENFLMEIEEDKIWDKAWWAQQVHVHGSIKGWTHSLCGAPDRTRTQTCPPSFRFLKTCSARKGFGLQEEDLLYKEETCSARIRLALQREDLLCKDKTCSTRKGGRTSLL